MKGFSRVEETLRRYGAALIEQRWTWALVALALVLGVACALVAQRSERWRAFSRGRPGLAWALLVPVVGLSLYYAWSLRWIGDDAFISFRYAKNLAEGHGLVFNAGARVEGYTNFLWTVLMAGFVLVGIHPGQASIVLGLASLAACLLLTARLLSLALATRDPGRARALSGALPSAPEGATRGARPPWLVSIAAVLLAGNYTFASWGTSGLETMTASALVLLAVERASVGALAAAGLSAIAATMMHPDHALFYVALGAVLLLERRPFALARRLLVREGRRELVREALRGWRRSLVGYALPFVGVYLPYFAWRTLYYGDWFPNTYYAKSGSEWYLSQGLEYLGVSGLSGGIWAMVLLALLGLWPYRRTLVARFTLVALPLYLFYVAKIGGDFMLGRLLCPALPFVFLMGELALVAATTARGWLGPALGLVALPLAALAATPALVVRPFEKYHYIADERTFYLLKSFSPLVVDSYYWHQAEALNQAFEKAPRPPVYGAGSVGILGYHTGMPMFDYFGLTEPSVAHMRIKRRGRPGHEKIASMGHALVGGADFTDNPTFLPPYQGHAQLRLGSYNFNLLKYDAELWAPLRRSRAVHVADFEQHVKNWRPPKQAPRAVCDVWFMSEFYFRHNPRERVERVGKKVRQALAKRLPPGSLDWVLYGTSPAEAGLRPLTRWSFDEPFDAGWSASGDAFGGQPRYQNEPEQQLIVNHEGPFISTFHPERGDDALGELRSPPFELAGDVLTLRVGGGHDLTTRAVRLVVDGQTVAELTGCNSEVMLRWAWDTSPWRGKSAELVVVDQSAGPWGHVLVDEIVQWQATTSADAR